MKISFFLHHPPHLPPLHKYISPYTSLFIRCITLLSILPSSSSYRISYKPTNQYKFTHTPSSTTNNFNTHHPYLKSTNSFSSFTDDANFANNLESREEYDPMSPSGPLDVNNKGEVWLPQQRRPRRHRRNRSIRSFVQQHVVQPSNLVYPIFIHKQEYDEEIEGIPGEKRLSLSSLLDVVRECQMMGINAFALFPVIDEHLRTNDGSESFNNEGLVCTAIRLVKEKCPTAIICCDVALDPFTDTHHDGIYDAESGKVLNDLTVFQLCKQAVCYANAGADFVCPSDMMDGRVSAIRDSLDAEGFTDTAIIAYTAKFASSLYGPFRNALGVKKTSIDKKTYQMDASNSKEANIEAALDVTEGADILLVKPGLPYLDIVSSFSRQHNIPIGVYHVSGEYAMIKAAAERGWIDEKQTVLESIKCMKRAGATIVFTYYAKQIAKWMAEDAAHDRTFTQLSY